MSGKSEVYVGLLAAAAMSAFNMVLFTEPVSRRNTFVRGKLAPPTGTECPYSFRLINVSNNISSDSQALKTC